MYAHGRLINRNIPRADGLQNSSMAARAMCRMWRQGVPSVEHEYYWKD